MTENERIWQFLESHKQEFLDYWAAQLKDASRVELVSYDPERMVGVLMSYNWQGVSKLVIVSPEELLASITGLSEQLVEDCQQATEEALDAAEYANGQGDYAKQQGDNVVTEMSQLEDLKETVRQQGNTSEAQGARAQSIYETVSAWYTVFRQDVENWLSGIQSTWNGWYGSTQNAWNTWFSDTQADWTAWFNARKAEWTTWFGDTQSAWTAWFNARKAEWNTWFADKQVEWTAWLSARLAELTASYSSAERARDSAYLDAESARDQLYMDAETQRMAAMTQTQCFVDTSIMHLILVQPENDETEYKVVNGRLKIITYYEDEEIEND